MVERSLGKGKVEFNSRSGLSTNICYLLICFLYCKFMASSIHADVARYHQRLLVARVKHLPIFLAISSKSINPETITRSYPDVQPEIPHFGFNFTQKELLSIRLQCLLSLFQKMLLELLRFAFNLPDLNSVFGQIIPTARPTFHTQTRQVVSKLGTRRTNVKRLAAQGILGVQMFVLRHYLLTLP